MKVFFATLGIAVAGGLAGLLLMEWRRFRAFRRGEGTGEYPRGRLLRRAASVLLLEGTLALVFVSEAGSAQAHGPWHQVTALGGALILAIVALGFALRDLHESARSAIHESEEMAAESVARLKAALRERGISLEPDAAGSEGASEPGGQEGRR